MHSMSISLFYPLSLSLLLSLSRSLFPDLLILLPNVQRAELSQSSLFLSFLSLSHAERKVNIFLQYKGRALTAEMLTFFSFLFW